MQQTNDDEDVYRIPRVREFIEICCVFVFLYGAAGLMFS
jgi:hypothetical protein